MTFCTGDPKKKKLFRPVHFTILKSGWTLFVLNRFGFYTCVKKPVWHCLIEVTKTQLNLVQYGSIQFGYYEQKPCSNLSFQAIKTRFNPVRFDTFLGFYESMLNSYAKSRLNTVKTFWTGFNSISLSGHDNAHLDSKFADKLAKETRYIPMWSNITYKIQYIVMYSIDIIYIAYDKSKRLHLVEPRYIIRIVFLINIYK